LEIQVEITLCRRLLKIKGGGGIVELQVGVVLEKFDIGVQINGCRRKLELR